MNVISDLNDKLLKQPFEEEEGKPLLEEYRHIACLYAKTENSIAVLSDLNANKSYIYKGKTAEKLGIYRGNISEEINSIWEEEIFSRIHPDDLLGKHMLELQFFQHLKNLPVSERQNYHATSTIRMRDTNETYHTVQHRIFYLCNSSQGNLWLSLCLYNFSYHKYALDLPDKLIVNSATGDIIQPDKQKYEQILSHREKEILSLIGKGKLSKEIAGILSISLHTVNRHRQNILEKLRVNNSTEAYRIAALMNLL